MAMTTKKDKSFAKYVTQKSKSPRKMDFEEMQALKAAYYKASGDMINHHEEE